MSCLYDTRKLIIVFIRTIVSDCQLFKNNSVPCILSSIRPVCLFLCVLEPGQPSRCSDQGAGWTFEEFWFVSRHKEGIYLSYKAFRPALGPTQPLIQWEPRTFTLDVQRSKYEAEHSSPFSTVIKRAWSLFLHSPTCLCGMHRDKYVCLTTLP